MSSVGAITTIVVALIVLVCYAFISQNLHSKRELRKRVTAALKNRTRLFRYMLDTFPKGFLSRQLSLFIYQNHLDSLEQLVKLEPSEKIHSLALQEATQQLTHARQDNSVIAPPKLDNPQKIKEIRMLLEELYKYIFRMEKRGAITPNFATSYNNEIKLLMLRTSVDSNVINGNFARQNGKTRLAMHYFQSAVELILKEGQTQAFAQLMAQLKEQLEELKAKAAEEDAESEPATAQEAAEQEELKHEWETFESGDDTWKKKRIYD